MSPLGSCNQTTGTQPGDRLRCALMIPLSGNRNYSGGTWGYQGVYGFYTSSSPSGVYVYEIYFIAGFAQPANTNRRSDGVSVRCLKN